MLFRSYTYPFCAGFFIILCLSWVHSAFADTNPKVFSTPDDAVAALIDATRKDSKDQLVTILGAQAEPLVSSGDAVADHEGRKKFLSSYDESHKLVDSGDDRKILVLGKDLWPMPIPLVLGKNGWSFDSGVGELEILNRRIGRNELNVINVCRSYVEAQREYYDISSKDNTAPEYAQKIMSTPGQHDGLYWPSKQDEKPSPLGPLLANATTEGYPDGSESEMSYPYHGYYYKVLTSQGSHAHHGAMSYIVDGHMTQGFALVAFPARYANSGIMTFIINQYGIVYEKNLGPDTASIASQMIEFDPDQSWHVVH